ncbi:MAG: hypothetical protein QGF09_07735 [Rhodospirillales bacterium]|nr:hypothetical protein [Rhodospirillales bacterium]
MAEIILGIGTSHSPQISTPVEKWLEGNERYQEGGFELHSARDGARVSYEELLEMAPPGLEKEITPEKFEARHAENLANLAWLGEVIADAAPDLLVIFGDDQKELFLDEQIPFMCVYWGESFQIIRAADRLSSLPGYSWPEPRTIQGHAPLARHLIEHLNDADINVSHASRLPEGKGMSHPFAMVHRQILDGNHIPTVPFWVNTFFPPNQPSPKRAYEIGRAVGRAIQDWPGKERVAIMASGGLSHFVLDEELDARQLKAMKERDTETIFNLPKERMQAGTSENLLWLAAAGALEHLDMTDTRYVPCYRNLAGTGCAMGFARWS